MFHLPFLISTIIILDDNLIIIIIRKYHNRGEFCIPSIMDLFGLPWNTVDSDRFKPILEGEGVVGKYAQIFRKMGIWIDAFAQIVELFC